VALNLSVLDGWWCEGYNGKNGWAIGAEIAEGSSDFQNEVDAASLYQLLEKPGHPALLRKAGWKVAARLAPAHARIDS
jgi:starch phosphorylase